MIKDSFCHSSSGLKNINKENNNFDRLNNPHFSLDLLRKSESSQFSANLPRFCSQKVKKLKI